MHSAEVGDCIGVESCANLKSDVDAPLGGGNRRRITRLESATAAAAEREYPPPIPWLVQTENLPSHMPWVMRKYYTEDGRLVIKEEKVDRHEYFKSHRSNGRLVINLIPLDDAVEESFKEHHAVENTVEEINGGDDGIVDPTVEKAVSEYCNYNGIRVNPCGGFAAAAAAAAVTTFRPPLHI
ncbi:hypothetical protein ACP275_14G289200 [Erythranthe tilingii]